MSDEQSFSPEPTVGAAPVHRTLGRPWQPGQSGNPSGVNGRNKGLAAMVRRQTKDGVEIVRLMYRMLKGGKFKRTVTDDNTGLQVDILVRPTIRDRYDAAVWLAERGWGKPKDVGEGKGTRPFMIVLPGGSRDPMDDPEKGVEPEKKLPALPPAMPEVGFDMDLGSLEEDKP